MSALNDALGGGSGTPAGIHQEGDEGMGSGQRPETAGTERAVVVTVGGAPVTVGGRAVVLAPRAEEVPVDAGDAAPPAAHRPADTGGAGWGGTPWGE